MASHIYPMLLAPRFDPKIWGGRRLETILGKPLPDDYRFGESLESDGESRILNGILAGNSISDLMRVDAQSILGTRGIAASGDFGDFPLLAKFIDASDILSVQVHPNDEEAAPIGKRGKTEAWHIIAADDDSTLITGLKPGVSIGDIAQAINEVTLDELVIKQLVTAGDTLIIPAGTIHAIGPGILLYEIQQASDVTYRMYDWGRVDSTGNPRQLHVSESLEVLKPDLRADRVAPLPFAPGRTMLAACRYFALERWDLPIHPATVTGDGGSFKLISSIAGAVRITIDDIHVDLPVGQTALIPASAPALTVAGDATLLVAYVPDISADIFRPLTEAGHDEEDIARLAGMLHHLQTA
jgi:mannose-6-phosphate isomerase